MGQREIQLGREGFLEEWLCGFFQKNFPAAPLGYPSLFLTDWEPSVLDQVTILSCPNLSMSSPAHTPSIAPYCSPILS